jgi:hypothetical protein
MHKLFFCNLEVAMTLQLREVTGRLPYVTKANFKCNVSDLDLERPKYGKIRKKGKLKTFHVVNSL